MTNLSVRHVSNRPAARKRRKAAAALSLVISLSIVQASFAQQAIIIDPSSMPSGSPLSREGSSGELPSLGQESSSGSSISSVSPIPVFKSGSISGAGQSQSLYEPRDEQAVTGRVAKPTPPNEFQNYVRRATGRDVKRFGSDLLTPAQANFNVPANSTVPGDYPIGIGDLVSVKWAESTLLAYVTATSRTGSPGRSAPSIAHSTSPSA
jgi:polysaccharide export outer membrane protein